jgi:hypothetical protein
LVIRKRLKGWLESGDGLGSTTFRHVLQMGYGLPKHAMVSGDQQRESVFFLTTHGYVPWDSRAPEAARLNARSAQRIKAKSDELVVQAETRAAEAAEKPGEVIIDAKKGDTEIDGEVLESVNPPPPPEDPRAFGGR